MSIIATEVRGILYRLQKKVWIEKRDTGWAAKGILAHDSGVFHYVYVRVRHRLLFVTTKSILDRRALRHRCYRALLFTFSVNLTPNSHPT